MKDQIIKEKYINKKILLNLKIKKRLFVKIRNRNIWKWDLINKLKIKLSSE